MSQGSMVVHVDFPDWENYSDPIKSLINFFMKDAAVYFQGKYTGTTLNSFSGNIRTRYRSVMQFVGDSSSFSQSNSIELNIPYIDSITYPVDAPNCLPYCITNIVTKQSTLKLVRLNDQSTTYEASLFEGGIDPIDSINVTLTPKINGYVIVASGARIHDMSDASPIISASINTNTQDFYSDYQLRTSSLYLDNGNGDIGEDIFYKIGIVPFNKKYPKSGSGSPVSTASTIESIKTALLNNGAGVMSINTGSEYVASGGYLFSILNSEFKYGTFDEMKGNVNNTGGKVPLSFILPIVPTGADSNYIVGLIYARMFKSDGSLVTEDDIEGYSLKLYYKTSEDDPSPQEIEYQSGRRTQDMSLTDQDMEGGYVQSPDNN